MGMATGPSWPNKDHKEKAFAIDGGCWCPGDRTLDQLRIMGHTKNCVIARVGWERNYQHLRAIERQKKEEVAKLKAERQELIEMLKLFHQRADVVVIRGSFQPTYTAIVDFAEVQDMAEALLERLIDG